MAAYPFGPARQVVPGSAFAIRDDLATQRSPNGGLEQYGAYTVFGHAFTLRHLLSSAEAATFRSFYATNRLALCALTFGGDGNAYSVRFAGAPREGWAEGFWVFDVDLLEA